MPRLAPLVVWCGALAAAVWLHAEQSGGNDAVGYVEVREVLAAPSVPGLVATLEVTLGQEVQEGELIATLDATELDARLRFAHAKLARARTSVAAMREEIRIDTEDRRAQADARLATHETEGRRIRKEIDRLVALETQDRAHIAGLEPQISRLGPLVGKSLMTAKRLEELELSREVLEARVASHVERVNKARKELVAWGELAPEPLAEPDVRAHLIPFELEFEVQEARVDALETERGGYRVLAPANGVVNRVLARAGEWRNAGEPVVEIVARTPNRVTVYVTGNQVAAVTPGVLASVRPRDRRGVPVEGRVVLVGARVDTIPKQLRTVPALPEWGRLVSVAIDDPADLLPGEVYGVRFR